jgi:hypothetical protein
MTARLRGYAVAQAATVRLAYHIIGGLTDEAFKGGIRHEEEEQWESYDQKGHPGFYPLSLTKE